MGNMKHTVNQQPNLLRYFNGVKDACETDKFMSITCSESQ